MMNVAINNAKMFYTSYLKVCCKKFIHWWIDTKMSSALMKDSCKKKLFRRRYLKISLLTGYKPITAVAFSSNWVHTFCHPEISDEFLNLPD